MPQGLHGDCTYKQRIPPGITSPIAVVHGREMVFTMRDRSPSDGYREWMVDSDIFGNLTEVRQGMSALTGEKRLAARSFETNEAVKTFAMQQFLHETYALQWGGIPDSLYQREIHFRQQIIDLETNFFMVRRRPNADSLIAANDQQLFALRDQYGIFLAALEKEYPEYFRLKYKQPVIRLRDVQHEALRAGQCLLDLYIKNDKVFALLIRPDTIVWIHAVRQHRAKSPGEPGFRIAPVCGIPKTA